MIRSLRSRSGLFVVLFSLLLPATAAIAQEESDPIDGSRSNSGGLIIQPAIGLQTMWFNGDYPVKQDISPGRDRELPLGGGILGVSNGLHLALEVIPSEGSLIRIPVSLDAFFLNGKTTFPFSRLNERPIKLLTYTHSANIFSVGTGLTLSLFKRPSLYFSAEAKLHYIPSTTLTPRLYTLDNDSTISEQTLVPDSSAHTRVGAYIKVGTQVDFFEPFLLDFSVGYGALNLFGKNTDAATQRNLMVVDPRNATEVTLGYIGVGLSVIWRL